MNAKLSAIEHALDIGEEVLLRACPWIVGIVFVVCLLAAISGV